MMNRSGSKPAVALMAADSSTQNLVDFVTQHRADLDRYPLLVPANLSPQLQRQNGLQPEVVQPIAQGGDTQIAAQVVIGNVIAVIYLIDAAMTHDPALQNLLRVCRVHDVPLATNLATAATIVTTLRHTRIGHLIFNPVSGQSDPNSDLAFIRQRLSPHMYLYVWLTGPETNPADLAKAALAHLIQGRDDREHPLGETHTDVIIAAGGDGTISAVAGAVKGTGIPLGIIPRGTANAFANALGLPTTLRGACDTILAGTTRIVDMAECNGNPMILLVGVGFEAEAIDRADRDMKNLLGPLAYVLAGIQQLGEQQLFHAEIEIDEVETEVGQVETGAITVANAAPISSILAQGFGQVIPDDGLLEITISRSQSRIQGINSLVSLFATALVRAEVDQDRRNDVICFRTRQVRITTDPPQKVVVDGEMIGTTPIAITCLPKSLRVLAPLSSRLNQSQAS